MIDVRAERVDGSGLRVEVDCRDLRADTTVGGLVLTVRDVTERRRMEEQLIRQAFHDSLTGLANRVLFQDRVEQAVFRGQHSGRLGVGASRMNLQECSTHHALSPNRGKRVATYKSMKFIVETQFYAELGRGGIRDSDI